MMQLIQMFYDPGKVFDFVRERRAWIIALIANVIVITACQYYITDAIGAGNITRHMLETSKFAANMPQEAKDKAIADADAPQAKIRTPIFTAIGVAVVYLISGLLFMAIAGASGGPIKFSQAMGAAAYGSWPFAVIKSILQVIVVAIAAEKSDLDPQHLLAFNAGALLDKASVSKPLYALASSIDILTFAGIALSAYGLAKVAKISFSKSLVGNILIWVVFTLLAVVAAMFF